MKRNEYGLVLPRYEGDRVASSEELSTLLPSACAGWNRLALGMPDTAAPFIGAGSWAGAELA